MLARAAEAMSAWLLNAGGRSATLMPVAQFNPFDKLDQPVLLEGGEAAAATDRDATSPRHATPPGQYGLEFWAGGL